MSSFENLSEIDPAVRAIAEVRAREAGMSLSQWLEILVYEHAAPTPARRYHFYGGAFPITSDGLKNSGALSLATTLLPVTGYDIDAHVYASWARRPRLPEIKTPNINPLVDHANAQEAHWSALEMITAFPPRISHAAILLSTAFAEADVEFRIPPHRPNVRHKATHRWYHAMVDTCLHRSREVRNALVHHWTPSGRAERLWGDAFLTLCELTPARQELWILFSHDRNRASAELAKHLDLATRQFELSANLLADVEMVSEPTEEQRFAQIRAELLDRAGGGVSLSEGSRLLGITRQALHKRIKGGSALGMKEGDEIVLPRLQWLLTGDKVEFVSGLPDVVRLFERAGGWSALQFLLDPDPNLGQPPIDVLRAGNAAPVVAAARAYLGLDEG